MENKIDRTIPGLLTSAGFAAAAAVVHGDSIGLLHNTVPKIRANIDALTGAVDTFESIRSELGEQRTALRQIVRESRSLLTVGRDVIKPFLGNEYNPAWDATGLVGSLVIPSAAEEVQPLLRSFKVYFAANPDQEVETRNVKVLNFDQLFTDLATRQDAIREQELLLDQARIVRDEKAALLRNRMRDLIEELDILIDPLDVRWKRFGFNMPGAEERPETPENFVVTLISPNAAAMKWEPASRSHYYHLFKRVVGVDEEPVLVGSPADLDFTIENLPSNAEVEVSVSAVNNGGESAPTKVVMVKTQ